MPSKIGNETAHLPAIRMGALFAASIVAEIVVVMDQASERLHHCQRSAGAGTVRKQGGTVGQAWL